MKYLYLLFLLPLILPNITCAQPSYFDKYTFTEADTLRGMLRPERTCYDVHFYKLNIQVNPDKQTIQGYNEIFYHTLEDFTTLQIDLYENMKIIKIVQFDKELAFKRLHNAIFVTLPEVQKKGTKNSFRVYYSGSPTIAANAPWDGGFVWSEDNQGKPWVGVACEGDGASLWWPNKDHLSDEPDSMLIQCAVPSDLMCVMNGNLRGSVELDRGYTQYDWFVSYPINNYNISVNIGDYAHFSDIYTSKFDGSKLQLDYYVLKENLEKAKVHFEQTKGVLESFEHYFGKYPFWDDGFAMVETPYLGMEHQSAIAYGNQYKNGYLGTGGLNSNGLKYDYIIVHEAGHEYFGNSISCGDLSEIWLHESFTTYMESLFVEYHHGYDKAVEYLLTQKPYIVNAMPMIGPRDVNWEKWGGTDQYYKGAWILHTLRSTIGDDELWFDILKSFHLNKKISIVTTQDFVNHVNEKTEKDYTAFFNQYLFYATPPVLLYKIKRKGKKGIKLTFKYDVNDSNFSMPIQIGNPDNYITINPTTEWQTIKIKNLSEKDFRIAGEKYLVKPRRRF